MFNAWTNKLNTFRNRKTKRNIFLVVFYIDEGSYMNRGAEWTPGHLQRAGYPATERRENGEIKRLRSLYVHI